MKDIERFFWQVYLNRSWPERHFPTLILEDVMAVNFASIFDRNYRMDGIDQLIYQIHKEGAGKRFIFMFEDGVNPYLTGAIAVMKNIIAEFDLNKETCLIVTRDDLQQIFPNVSVFKEDSIILWAETLWPTIKNIPIHVGPFDHKFAVWFHRGTFYRLQIARQLYTKYSKDSFISYQEQGMLYDRQYAHYFKDDIEWANANTPIIYDQLFPMRVYDHEMIVGASRKPYDKYFMEIVVETDCISNTWITEKTVKNLYIGKPFIMMAAPYSLCVLKEKGFKTFDKWFDESYDTITNNYLRLEAIKAEIDRIALLSYDQLNNMFQEMLPILEHNRNLFKKVKMK